jgi:hypothetical protein
MKRLITITLVLLYITLTFGGTIRPETEACAPSTVKVVKLPTEIPELTQDVTEPTVTVTIDPYEAELIAKTLYGEARGCGTTEQAAVCWTILNRVNIPGFGGDIAGVITMPHQFAGYRASNPILPELYDLAVDVLTRWEREKLGETDVGRVLPREFLWFSGDGKANCFRDAYIYGETWDWSLPSPYEEA